MRDKEQGLFACFDGTVLLQFEELPPDCLIQEYLTRFYVVNIIEAQQGTADLQKHDFVKVGYDLGKLLMDFIGGEEDVLLVIVQIHGVDVRRGGYQLVVSYEVNRSL